MRRDRRVGGQAHLLLAGLVAPRQEVPVGARHHDVPGAAGADLTAPDDERDLDDGGGLAIQFGLEKKALR